MRRLLCVVIMVASLLGCGRNDGLDKSLQLRDTLLQGAGCSFDCVITADYGEKQYTFEETCKSDGSGNLTFQVLKPESISGITGGVDGTGGKLTFEDQILAFPLLADGLLTPVTAPWLFLHSLRSGYINACECSSDEMQMIIHDSFQNASVETHIYCNKDNVPYFAEIYWESRRIVTLQIDNFVIV